MADLAVQFPAAQIFGLEPEPASARLARQNTLPWAARCCVIEAAAWPTDGQVGYLSTTSRFASVKVNTSGRASGTHSITQAISLNTLIERSGDFDRVDFVKMDIEGAERRLLTECTEWAHRVHCIKVEVHPPYTPEDCIMDLRALGFLPKRDRWHSMAVIGLRH
jgi:FkbM family methyltransferase